MRIARHSIRIIPCVTRACILLVSILHWNIIRKCIFVRVCFHFPREEKFSLPRKKETAPPGNRLLYGPDKQRSDSFDHEQNLLLEEDGHTVLLAGCAHCGIVAIMQEATRLAGHPPTHVFAGMHLMKSGLSPQDEERYIHDLASSLLAFPRCHYYTMHCTGVEQFEKLHTLMPGRISYLGTGEAVDLN